MTLFVPELDINTIVIENVERQVNHIDVLLTVHDDRNRYKIIVEDKTFTSEHDNQLLRYMEYAKKEYPDVKVRGVYYKTGFQCDTEDVLKAEYNLVSREDILQFLKPYAQQTTNQIIIDYYEYWLDFQKEAMAYRTKTPLQWDWKQINAFYEFIQKNGTYNGNGKWLGYGYIANQTGGFYGLWTGMDDCRLKIGSAEYSLYLQVEAYTGKTTEHQICLKLCFEDGNNVRSEEIRSVRDQIVYSEDWKYKLIDYGFNKPKRIGSGKHMTIGVYSINVTTYETLILSIEKAFSNYEQLLNNLRRKYTL